MLTDWRKTLDRVAERAGWKAGEVRTKAFRHTYTAARLQTVEGGSPVSPFTVSRELGLGSRTMVEEVYAHWALCGTDRKPWSTGLSSTRKTWPSASPSSRL
jgi:integrase